MEVTPGQLIDEIEDSRARLMAVGYTFSDQRRQLAEKQLKYEKAMGREYLKMIAESEKKGTRVPAEDMRKAIAHSKIADKVWEEYLLALADVEASERLLRCEQSNLSGLQSELQQLRVEWTHA